MTTASSDIENARSIALLFLSSSERHPERPALNVNGESHKYIDLAKAAIAIAATLDDIGASTRIGVVAYRSFTTYAGILGILLSGRTYVPLNPKFPAERNRKIAGLADLEHILCERENLRQEADNYRTAKVVPQLISIANKDDEAKADEPGLIITIADHGSSSLSDVNTAEHAYIMFTSGTTGDPKGVPITHANVNTYVANLLRTADLHETDKFSQIFDLTFDLSVHDMFVCWAAGGCLCVVPERATMSPAKFIREQEITVWFSVPSTVGFMNKLRTLKAGLFPTLRFSWFCGEALPVESARIWSEAAPNSIIENLYGPTEATIAFTRYRWNGDELGDTFAGGYVPIGKAMGDLETIIVDSNGLPARPGEVGELCLGGAQLSPGYWRNPEKTSESFVHASYPGKVNTRWYKTGDLAEENPHGNVEFVGRLDSQVKILGYRVELGEIERVVRQTCETELAAVVAWPRDGATASGVVAFVSGSVIEPQVAIRACQEILPSYMVPKNVIAIEQMPLNANGKIDRGALERMLADEKSNGRT